jgi:hypothetical protein
MRTTLSNSVTFSSDGSVYSLDGQVLNKAVYPANAVPDSQKAAGIGIQTRTGELYRHNSATGPATQSPGYTSAQLRAPDGKVQVGAYRTDPATVENLKVMAPELFVDPSVKAIEAAKVADAAREDAAQAADLSRHHDDTLEAYHQHLVGEVSQQNLIGLMVYGQKNETPPADLLKTIAQEMGEPLDKAIDKVNAVIGGVHRQFNNLATAMGVDPEKAAVWLKDHRKDTAMVVSQAHLMRRDVRGWLPLLEDYRRATGDGVAH